MSPSENDLRAALHDGEDDGRPDVDGLLAHVRGRRAQRRTRVLSAAAAVVVVAAAAVGGAALWGGSDGNGQRAGSSPGVTGAPSGAATASFGVGTGRLPCPAQYPSRGPSTGGTTAGRMFGAPVTTVTVCSYTDGGAPGTAVAFTGSDATALANSIETASTSKLRIMCPDIASQQKRQLAILGVTSGGTRLPVVTTDVSIPNCNRPISNGTAVRYAWKPPAALASRIAALNVRALPSGGTPGAKIGTPVR